MKLLQTIFCMLGLHDWRQVRNRNQRQCLHCNLRQRRTYYDCTKWENV